tara:strand:- start:95168 stop:95281 length:114 start_codon:yes stop_codon:yes gene_type:complete
MLITYTGATMEDLKDKAELLTLISIFVVSVFALTPAL